MSKTARSMVAIPVAVILAGLPGLPLSAMAQQPTDQPSPKKPAVRGQPIHPQNPPGQLPHAGPAPAEQIHAPEPLGQGHEPAQPAPIHRIERDIDRAIDAVATRLREIESLKSMLFKRRDRPAD